MRYSSVVRLLFATLFVIPSTVLGADTHVIVGTQQITWTYNGQSSTRTKPLIVDDLKVGDVVEIQIPAGSIPHGFITLTKAPNTPPVETKDLVLVCGESRSSKPNAVLRETACGTASQFGKQLVGTMRLEVLDTFKGDTDFWCVFHKGIMAGTLKLKQ